MRPGGNWYRLAKARWNCAQPSSRACRESGCKGLGEHQFWCVSLSRHAVVWQHKHYCPGKICRLQPKLMISKALPRVEAGNDLNSNSPILSEIWGREVLGMFATMPHESWPNRLFPIAPASTSQTISKVRSSLWRRFLREEPLLLGLVPCHGVRTTDLPREPA